jgi:hypothetical protein
MSKKLQNKKGVWRIYFKDYREGKLQKKPGKS